MGINGVSYNDEKARDRVKRMLKDINPPDKDGEPVMVPLALQDYQDLCSVLAHSCEAAGHNLTRALPVGQAGIITCDWGRCNEIAHSERWSVLVRDWLPVCAYHLTGPEVK